MIVNDWKRETIFQEYKELENCHIPFGKELVIDILTLMLF